MLQLLKGLAGIGLILIGVILVEVFLLTSEEMFQNPSRSRRRWLLLRAGLIIGGGFVVGFLVSTNCPFP